MHQTKLTFKTKRTACFDRHYLSEKERIDVAESAILSTQAVLVRSLFKHSFISQLGVYRNYSNHQIESRSIIKHSLA